jgi:uncharacterized surface protein with fasciclin (FAS1) repeats
LFKEGDIVIKLAITKEMKKIIGFSFLVLMVFVIGACTSDATDENTTPMVTTTEQMTTEEMTTEEETTENQEPTLNIVETAEAAGSFTTLLAALDQAGLSATLEGEGSFTVFAPTDQAFTDLLTALDIDAATLLGVENLSDILLYHVLDGAYYASDVVANAPFSMASLEGSDVNFTVMDGKAYINDVEIITTDILTSNGVIHVIEEVILPLNNIVETAEAAGSFTTLLAALDQAGLSATLEGEGSFTVFAPTDQAFTDLATSLSLTLEDILALSNLDQILLFHVIDGIYYSTDVINATPISIASMQTTNLDFTLMNQMIYVNGVEVVKADILTTNGIIHVIGEVLLYE